MQIETSTIIEKLAKKYKITLGQAKDIIKFQARYMVDNFSKLDIMNDKLDVNFLINGFGTIYVNEKKVKWVKTRTQNKELNESIKQL